LQIVSHWFITKMFIFTYFSLTTLNWSYTYFNNLNAGYQWYAANVLWFLDATYSYMGDTLLCMLLLHPRGRNSIRSQAVITSLSHLCKTLFLWICSLFHYYLLNCGKTWFDIQMQHIKIVVEQLAYVLYCIQQKMKWKDTLINSLRVKYLLNWSLFSLSYSLETSTKMRNILIWDWQQNYREIVYFAQFIACNRKNNLSVTF